MILPEIPTETLGDQEEKNPGLFRTRYTTLAAILCACAEIKWYPEESIQYFEKGNERFYEFKFCQNELATRLNACFERHRAFVQQSPDHWFARCLDVFHNRERLLEIAKGPPARVLRKHRRIFLDRMEGPELNRTVLATDGKLTIDRLDLIALLLAEDTFHLTRGEPLTMTGNVRRFNFEKTQRLTSLCETFFKPERFVASHPEDWRSYAISALANYRKMVYEILPKAKLQRLKQTIIPTADGRVKRTLFPKPEETLNA